jgi:hypothetical protein
MQPGERQVLFRLPAGRRPDPHSRQPGLPRSLGQQDSLAHARIAKDQQHPALLIWRGRQFPQPRQFLRSPDQARAQAGNRGNASIHPANIGKVIRPEKPARDGRAVKLRIPDGRFAAQGYGMDDARGLRRNAGS